MNYSWQYTQTMSGLLRTSTASAFSSVEDWFPFGQNSSYIKWFSLKPLSVDKYFEIPVCLTGFITNNLRHQNSEIIIPVYIDNRVQVISGAETILKAFSRRSFYEGLVKVETPNNSIYYGCEGLILDSMFRVLFMATLKGKFDGEGIVYDKRVIHINPSVFINDDDPLCKSLARKGVPYFLSRSIGVLRSALPYNSVYTSANNDAAPTIVIDDTSSWMCAPKRPANPINITEDLNTFTREHLLDVLTQIRNDIRRDL